MRVKPHMSTNAKHRKTRIAPVWQMTAATGGSSPGGSARASVAGADVDGVDVVQELSAAAAMLRDQPDQLRGDLHDALVLGVRALVEQRAGAVDGRGDHHVIALQTVDLGCGFRRRVVEQLLEQPARTLGVED